MDELISRTNDFISRKAAIDVLHMDTSIIPFRKAREYVDVTIEEIRNRLEKLPSAQPEQRWIPCGERLPEKPNMYTVTDSKGNVVRFVFYDTKSSREYWQRCAKAWMPLPEPYREERRADEQTGPNCGAKMRDENDEIPDDIPMEYFLKTVGHERKARNETL